MKKKPLKEIPVFTNKQRKYDISVLRDRYKKLRKERKSLYRRVLTDLNDITTLEDEMQSIAEEIKNAAY